MRRQEKSDSAIVAVKRANEAGRPAEEPVEPRVGAKENAEQGGTLRTPGREGASHGLERVRQTARLKKEERFTALLHHVDGDQLREAYFALKREAAPGVDGVTWEDYGGDGLEARLEGLRGRVHSGSYRAQPSRRRFIPKPDGRQRPLGIAALEDKIVQRALVEVLNAIYEEDFLGFSYGFRPGRGQHDALDALAVGIDRTAVNWVLDADIAGFNERPEVRPAISVGYYARATVITNTRYFEYKECVIAD
jgi:RNA-directed DNA polymerase